MLRISEMNTYGIDEEKSEKKTDLMRERSVFPTISGNLHH
jgi:hypothetical protein